MNDKQKRARFRQLSHQAGVQTGEQFAEEYEQPRLDFDDTGAKLIDDVIVTDMETLRRRSERESIRLRAKSGFTGTFMGCDDAANPPQYER
jgi:hypothetical protein